MLDWKSVTKYWNKRTLVQPEGTVGLARYEEGLAICHALNQDEHWQITDAEFAEVLGENEQVTFIKQWLKDRNLLNASCQYVLSTKEYELLLLEAPPVEDSELLNATLWRVKDLIKEPIEDMAVDVMRLPADAYRGRQNMIYAVVSKKEAVKSHLKFIKRCGLTPAVLDIPEMCWRNLLSHVEDADTGSIATLCLRRSNGIMVVYSADSMYLTRQIEMGIKNFSTSSPGSLAMDNGVMIDRLALDIQRSLDYYESQVGKGIVKRIYFLPITNEQLNIFNDVRPMLQTSVEPFSINQSVNIIFEKTLTPREQAYCLPVIGSAVRVETLHAAD